MNGEIIPRRVLCPWRAHLLASTLPAVARRDGRLLREVRGARPTVPTEALSCPVTASLPFLPQLAPIASSARSPRRPASERHTPVNYPSTAPPWNRKALA
eukprot:scaffold62421_cov69-Phaeocystis_antarctica.AAC.1